MGHIYGQYIYMKTTVEIPDELLRRAKMVAAQQGVSMRSMIVGGLERFLSEREARSERPWMNAFAGMAHRREESAKIGAEIDGVFGRVDGADWE